MVHVDILRRQGIGFADGLDAMSACAVALVRPDVPEPAALLLQIFESRVGHVHLDFGNIPEMNSIVGKSRTSGYTVGLVISSLDLYFCLRLGMELKRTLSCAVVLYVRTERERAGVMRLPEAAEFDAVVVCAKLRERIAATAGQILDHDEIGRVARAWEEKLGETYSRLYLDHRQFGRGFMAGGHGVPAVRGVADIDQWRKMDAMNFQLNFWDNEIRERNICLIAGGEKWLAALCRHYAIPFRKRCFARLKSQHYWSTDEYLSNPGLRPAFDKMPPRDPVVLKGSFPAQIEKNARQLARMSYSRGLYHFLEGVVLGARSCLIERNLRPLSWQMLTHNFRPPKELRALRSFPLVRLADLKGRPFVYFPLHKEPETDYLAASPECLDQIGAILQLARDLPADWVLAVKEHIPSIGLRPDGYYRRLATIHNVVLVDPTEPSIPLIQECRAVATISGTAGLEGAMIGKPVVQFARRTLNGFLQHVFTVNDVDDTARFIDRLLHDGFDLEQARADGARFAAAIEAASFNGDDLLSAPPPERGATQAVVERAARALLDCVGQDGRFVERMNAPRLCDIS